MLTFYIPDVFWVYIFLNETIEMLCAKNTYILLFNYFCCTEWRKGDNVNQPTKNCCSVADSMVSQLFRFFS
jgi:hypothetical protein